MPCDIAISTETRDQWQSEMNECRAEVREERGENAELIGKLETCNKLFNEAHIQRIELERKNATLAEKAKRRAKRERVAWSVAAASTIAAILAVLLTR